MVNDADVVLELYNLRADPGETINLALSRLRKTKWTPTTPFCSYINSNLIK